MKIKSDDWTIDTATLSPLDLLEMGIIEEISKDSYQISKKHNVTIALCVDDTLYIPLTGSENDF